MTSNSSDSFIARILGALLFLATIFAPVASANICDLLILNRVAEKSALRQNYANLSAAALRTEAGGMYNSLFHARKDRALLKTFFEAHLKKLNELAQLKLEAASHPRVLAAYAKLRRLSERVLANDRLTMNQFNRVAFLYAQLLDLLLAEDVSVLLANHDQSRAYEVSKGRPVVSLMDSIDEELMSWIQVGVLNPIHTSTTGLSTIYPSEKGWTLQHTFAALSFRTILWGISRGIFFIGQTGKMEVVDGTTYSPSIFASHDYIHALIATSRFYDSSSRRLWDQLEFDLDSAKLSPKNMKIYEGILFFAFHEYTTFEMTCSSLKRSYEDLRRAFMFDLNRGELEERFNDKADFGQAFPQPVTQAELKSAIDGVLNSITRSCLTQ